MAADDFAEPEGADARTLALSDAVFAIALTLLVLSIGVPTVRQGDSSALGHALLDHRNELFSWVISFLALGLMWIHHREFFASVTKVPPGLTTLNLVYLAEAAFLPYPSLVLGHYGGEPPAIALYAVTLALLQTTSGLMAVYAFRRGLVRPGKAAKAASPRHWFVAPLIVLAAIPLSFVVGRGALLIWATIPLVVRRRD